MFCVEYILEGRTVIGYISDSSLFSYQTKKYPVSFGRVSYLVEGNNLLIYKNTTLLFSMLYLDFIAAFEKIKDFYEAGREVKFYVSRDTYFKLNPEDVLELISLRHEDFSKETSLTLNFLYGLIILIISVIYAIL